MRNKFQSITKRLLALSMCMILCLAHSAPLLSYAVESIPERAQNAEATGLGDTRYTVNIAWKDQSAVDSNGIAKQTTGSRAVVVSISGTPQSADEVVTFSVKTFDISASAENGDYISHEENNVSIKAQSSGEGLYFPSYEFNIDGGVQKRAGDSSGEDYIVDIGGTRYTRQFGIKITKVSENAKVGTGTIRAYTGAGTKTLYTDLSGGYYAYRDAGKMYVTSTYTASGDFEDGKTSSPHNLHQKGTATFKFGQSPRTVIQNSKYGSVLLERFPNTQIYYTGVISIGGYYNLTQPGFKLSMYEGSKNIFNAERESNKTSYKDKPYSKLQWFTDNGEGAYQTVSGRNNLTLFGAVRKATVGGTSMSFSLFKRYDSSNEVKLTLYNAAIAYNKKIYDLHLVSTMVDTEIPVVTDVRIDNSITYGYSDNGGYDEIYLAVQFSEPIQVFNATAKNMRVTATVGNRELYFWYDGGNYTDTLIFKATLDTSNGDYYGSKITLGSRIDCLTSSGTQPTIFDLSKNSSNKNNQAEQHPSLNLSSKDFSVNIDTRKPSVSSSTQIKDTAVKDITVGIKISSMGTNGKVTYKWSDKADITEAGSGGWTTLDNYKVGEENLIYGTGMNDYMYLHIKAESVTGNTASYTTKRIYFDATHPEIDAPTSSEYNKYTDQHDIVINVNDAHGTQINYIYAYVKNIDGEYVEGWNGKIVYDSAAGDSANKMEHIGNGSYKMTLTCADLGVGDGINPDYGAYTVGFTAKDKFGNVHKVDAEKDEAVWIGTSLRFDSRDAFNAAQGKGTGTGVTTLNGLDVYYPEGGTKAVNIKIESTGQNAQGYTYRVFRIMLDNQTIYDCNAGGWQGGLSFADHGFAQDPTSSEAVRENGTEMLAELSFAEGTNGRYEIVYDANGQKQSIPLEFYVSASMDKTETTNYKQLYNDTRLLINKVWSFKTNTYYSQKNQTTTSYYDTGVTSANPIFSSPEKAFEYAKYMELLDITIEYIEDENKAQNLNSGIDDRFRKADGIEQDAHAGETWICYKKKDWLPNNGSNSAARTNWVYYYYAAGRVSSINESALSDVIMDAIKDNAADIAGVSLIGNNVTYSEADYMYLTRNNGRVDSKTGEPTYSKTAIFYEESGALGAFSSEVKYTGDKNIYSSFVNVNVGGESQSLPLVANYTFNIPLKTDLLYYRYADSGNEEWIPISSGQTLRDIATTTGRYELAELSGGYKVYSIWCDITAPSLYYTAQRGEGTQPIKNFLNVSSEDHSSTFNSSSLMLDKILTANNGASGDGVGVPEYDEYAYVYLTATSFTQSQALFYTLEEINKIASEGGSVSIPDGSYIEIVVCDRLGNTVTRSPVRIKSSSPMPGDDDNPNPQIKNDASISFKFNRSSDEVEEFYIKRGSTVCASTYTDQEYSYVQAGTYSWYLRDIYGNVVSGTKEFVRSLPEVSFMYKNPNGTGYSPLAVTDGTQSDVVVGAVCEMISDGVYHITSAEDIRIVYSNSKRYDIVQVIPTPTEDNTNLVYTAGTNGTTQNFWTLPMNDEPWEIKICHSNDPGTYIRITCLKDNAPPTITAAAMIPSYDFFELKNEGNVGYRRIEAVESVIGDGTVVDADSVTLNWADESSIASVFYTFNDGEPIGITDTDIKSQTFTEKGKYVLTVTDILGNTASFTTTLEHKPIDAEMTVGGEKAELSEALDHNGVCIPTEILTGKSMSLTLRERSEVTLSYFKEGNTDTLIYCVNYGGDQITVSKGTYDAENGFTFDNSTVQGFELAAKPNDTLIDNDGLKLTYEYVAATDNEGEKLILYFSEPDAQAQKWQIRVTDDKGDRPAIIYVESSSEKPSLKLTDAADLNSAPVETVSDDYAGANTELTLIGDTSNIKSIAAYYSSTLISPDNIEGEGEKISLWSDTGALSIEKSGYYKIVAENKYGNIQILLVRISFGVEIDANISYGEGVDRAYEFDAPVSYSLYSNKEIEFMIWYNEVTVTVTKDGVETEPPFVEGQGTKKLVFGDAGEYVLKIQDDCRNTYLFNISIKLPENVTDAEYLCGFNSDAVLRSELYTNGMVSISKDVIDEHGVAHIAYRHNGGEPVVIYDKISQVNVEYDEEAFMSSIGAEDGEYEIVFSDSYGNRLSKKVRVSRARQLSITRNVQSSENAEAVDFSGVISSGVWSNYAVMLKSTASSCKLIIDGETAEFNENGEMKFVLSLEIPEGGEDHSVCYIDEYGNKYEFTVHLYRKTPTFSQAVSGELISVAGATFIKGDVSYSWDSELITASYIKDQGEPVAYTKGELISEDGVYQVVFTDIAGNTAKVVINRDTTVDYRLMQGVTELPDGITVTGGVTISNNKEEVTIKEVICNGDAIEHTGNVFSEQGFYTVTVQDNIGNTSTVEFDVIKHPMQSFRYSAHSGFVITQVFMNADGQNISYAASVFLDENGRYCYDFFADGSYDVELWHKDSNTYHYFHIDIDNVCPEVTLDGVENGGTTRQNVKLVGLMADDTVEIWLNGELISTQTVGNSGGITEISDPGEYKVVIRDQAGNLVEYTFVREYTTNAASNVSVCLLLILFSVSGVILLRGRGRVRNK